MRLAAALMVTLMAGLAPQAARARPTCHVRGAHTVLTTGQVVLVRRGIHYVACSRASGRRTKLADDFIENAPRHFRIRGRFVAYDRDDGCFDPCWRIVVLDVSSGKKRASYASYGMESTTALRRLVLDERGRVAWIRDFATGPELHRMDSDGEETIDTGPGVEVDSLAIGGGRVTWQDGGQPRSSQLDSHPPCARTGSSTLIRTDQERIYWLKERVYGCLLATGRTTFLGGQPLEDFEYYGGGFVRAAGNFAAIDEGFGGRSGANADLLVWDVSTGKQVHRWSWGGGSADTSIEAVVLAANGAIAWIDWRTVSDRVYQEVRKSDADENATLLDQTVWRQDGTGIDEHSLTLAGQTVQWLNGGQQHSATLR